MENFYQLHNELLVFLYILLTSQETSVIESDDRYKLQKAPLFLHRTITCTDKMMRIRTATQQDSDVIHQIHLSAFPESENARVARLATDLLAEKTAPPALSLLAELDALVVGHVAFSPVAIDTDPSFQGSILAPLVVLPSHQRQGIGAQLVAKGLQKLTAAGVQTVFVYGDPNYYSRFGFATEIAQSYLPPCPLQYPFGWQALALAPYPGRKEPMRLRCAACLHHPQLW